MSKSSSSPVAVLLTFLFLVPVWWVGYEVFVEGRTVEDSARDLLSLVLDDQMIADLGFSPVETPSLSDDSLDNSLSEEGDEKEDVSDFLDTAEQVADMVAAVDSTATGSVNPYLGLPNDIDEQRLPPKARRWTPEEEDALRASLIHQFAYQRYKAVQDVRRDMFSGSDVILREALRETKFWTRMEALMGLGDFGVPITSEMVETALGNAGKNLQYKYFKRFRNYASAGELYALRQCIRVVKSPARLPILQAFLRNGGKQSRKYLSAAHTDPTPNVKRWIRKNPVPMTIERDPPPPSAIEASPTSSFEEEGSALEIFDIDLSEL